MVFASVRADRKFITMRFDRPNRRNEVRQPADNGENDEIWKVGVS
ncbi:hypothetical protein [Amycolatopsis sp. NPDC051903]